MADNSNQETEGTAISDQSENGITLGDALNQAKGTSLASVEELHNLAGGADIKVCLSTCNSFTIFPFTNAWLMLSVEVHLNQSLLASIYFFFLVVCTDEKVVFYML